MFASITVASCGPVTYTPNAPSDRVHGTLNWFSACSDFYANNIELYKKGKRIDFSMGASFFLGWHIAVQGLPL